MPSILATRQMNPRYNRDMKPCDNGNRSVRISTYALRKKWESAHGPVDWDGWKIVLRHMCDNPLCGEIEHIKIGTQTENLRDATVQGKKWGSMNGPGEAHQNAKLTEGQVAQIRDMVRRGMKQREVAQEFGITQPQVSRIASRKRW